MPQSVVSSPTIQTPSPLSNGKEAEDSTPSARFSRGCEIEEDHSCAGYPDGSRVVRVVDYELGCTVYMRRFPNGEMIPLDKLC
jgi:hypothetical protein